MLIDELIKQGYLKTPIIIEAFRKINRADFLSKEIKDEAELNIPLPIGFGQTISQPLTVAFMMELLDARPGNKVADIGSGSGWTAALLSDIVGTRGIVYGVEIIPQLLTLANINLKKVGYPKTVVYKSDKKPGLAKFAPYNRILVSAASQKVPKELIGQLKTGGKMVIPIGGSIFKIDKLNNAKLAYEEFPGFAFVPLVSD